MAPRTLLALALVAAGCGGGDRPAAQFSVTDSAGVAVVRNVVPAQDTIAVEHPAVRIGGLDIPEPYVFEDVRDVVAFTDGTIVVADAGGRIARFNPRGEWLQDIGRQGSGPGEYQQPFQSPVRHDTLAVWDVALRRFSLFSMDGTFVAAVPITKESRGTRLERIGDVVVDEIEWGQTADTRPAEAAIVRGTSAGDLDTLKGPYAVPEFGWEVDARTAVGTMVNPPVFSVRPPWRLCDGRLYWADPAAARVEVYRLDGALARVIHLAREDRAVTAADRDAYIVAVAERWNLGSGMTDQLRRTTPFAARAPRATGLVCGENAETWVADFQPALPEPVDAVGNEWSVLAREGVETMRVVFPHGFTLKSVAGGNAYGVARREMGVQVIEAYRLPASRPAGRAP